MGPSFENHPSRGRAVTREGDDLVFQHRNRRELLGLFTGRHWSWPVYRTAAPDPGWAENEARRIREAAEQDPVTPCAWVYMTRMSEGAHGPLARALSEAGGHEDYFRTTPGGVIFRRCFTARR